MIAPENSDRRDRSRIGRERRTIEAMVKIYCRAQHGTTTGLCAECGELLAYASGRLERCPFGAEKPTCAKCPIHCYKPAMRERVRQVMRFAGPRMVWRHPLLAALHTLDSLLKRARRTLTRKVPSCRNERS